MELEKIVKDLYQDSKQNTPRGLANIANSEKLLEQAYEGRYFFELIQNVRDANKEVNKNGSIFIVLAPNLLTVSNTGAEFSDKGIESITTIGESPKHSQDFIGFKGVGFKSVQEITDKPRIGTCYGTVVFDRELTLREYQGQKIKAEKIPLFFFPHFERKKINEREQELGIVTKVELPLKNHITEESIVQNFLKIQPKQLVLLGNLKQLKFDSASTRVVFDIIEIPAKNYLEVRKNDTEIHKYKVYSPSRRVIVPRKVIESLDGKEKDIFSDSPQVDVKIVVELNEHRQIKPVDDAALYLFYPLEIRSGFRFIIHSYFIVNPERKNLRDSPLNTFLLNSIGEFIGNELLGIFKDKRINTTKLLAFKRNEDAKLTDLYDKVVDELKKQKFVYDNQTKKYFAADEIIIADNFNRGLFPEGKLGDKQLIYIDDPVTKEWLEKEFSVPYLTYEKIAGEIEGECRRQLKKRNLSFFRNLYKYVNNNELDLTGRKVLLTDDWELASSDDDVFYIGREENRIKLPKSINRHIKFINEKIKISDLRDGKNKIGIREYSRYELIRRILRLFDNPKVPNADILNTIFNLEIDSKSESEIKEKILFPIKGSKIWLSPVTNPIYFETEEIKNLYPRGKFVDENVLNANSSNETIDKRAFLKKFGVWDIPAVFLQENAQMLSYVDKRNSVISNISNLWEKPFTIKNDRILDVPKYFNYWFTDAVIENWNVYKSFILNKSLPKIQYWNTRSYIREVGEHHTLGMCGFIDALKREKWIVFSGSDESHPVKNIVGIDPYDFRQSHNQVIKKFLKLLPLKYSVKKDFFESLEMIHLDRDDLSNFKELLRSIYKKYKDENISGKEFEDFYNRILKKLVDFYLDNEDDYIDIESLSDEFFLAINKTDNRYSWKKAEGIFHLDDKPDYDLLPLEIKQKVQPHFTNRDKNTFGRIASKIGQSFSDSIERELIKSDPLKTVPLVTYFEQLPECLAILESFLETALNDKFDLLKKIRVFEMETIKVNVSVLDSAPVEINVDFFVDGDSNYDIYLSTGFSISRNKLLADVVSELFVKILDRDLKKFGSIINMYLNASNKAEILAGYDITDERITEIKDQLSSVNLTPAQRIWDAVLSAKEISLRDEVFNDKDVVVERLAEKLQISPGFIERFQKSFSFAEPNKSSNIGLISELMTAIDLSLSKLNEFIFPRLDYRAHYNKALNRLKNKFVNKFEAMLHNYLKSKTMKQQESYLDNLDFYKYDFNPSVAVDLIAFNLEDFFVSSLNSQFKSIPFSKDDLRRKSKDFNSVEIFKRQFELLREKLDSVEYSPEQLEAFLSNKKLRSLLYFDAADALADSFTSWLAENQKQNKLRDEENLELVLAEFTGQNEAAIVEVSISSVDLPETVKNDNHSSNGKRVDGSAGEQYKRNIGLVAELKVYEQLKKKYKNVIWVSKNASKIEPDHPGYNPDGDDSLGYDIEYLDDEGNKYFVEVKGKTDAFGSFEISKSEIEKAHQARENYKLFFVTNTLDNSSTRINDLGNLFLLDKGEDFLSNNKFTVISKSFEIRFTLNNN